MSDQEECPHLRLKIPQVGLAKVSGEARVCLDCLTIVRVTHICASPAAQEPKRWTDKIRFTGPEMSAEESVAYRCASLAKKCLGYPKCSHNATLAALVRRLSEALAEAKRERDEANAAHLFVDGKRLSPLALFELAERNGKNALEELRLHQAAEAQLADCKKARAADAITANGLLAEARAKLEAMGGSTPSHVVGQMKILHDALAQARAEVDTIKKWSQAQHDADGEVIKRLEAEGARKDEALAELLSWFDSGDSVAVERVVLRANAAIVGKLRAALAAPPAEGPKLSHKTASKCDDAPTASKDAALVEKLKKFFDLYENTGSWSEFGDDKSHGSAWHLTYEEALAMERAGDEVLAALDALRTQESKAAPSPSAPIVTEALTSGKAEPARSPERNHPACLPSASDSAPSPSAPAEAEKPGEEGFCTDCGMTHGGPCK